MRVEDRLAMLGRNSTLDDLDQEQMRSLLTGQLEVFARLTARQEQVVNQRGVLIDRLRSLWTAVRQLGAADATPTVRASSVESLRELHLAIEREVVHRRSSATRATTTEARPTVAERGADDTSVHRGRA